MGTYRLRVPASRVGYVPDAQGGLPPGPTYCTYGVHVPASGVGYVPGTVAPQVALPKACAGAADRQALLDFGATPAQCAKAGATGCRYKYSAGGCS